MRSSDEMQDALDEIINTISGHMSLHLPAPSHNILPTLTEKEQYLSDTNGVRVEDQASFESQGEQVFIRLLARE